MLFEAKEIVKKYAEHTALNKVSISVPEQSIFGLLGPNGAGKTTLIRIINQIIAPDSGELLLNGKKLVAQDVHRIGYLPEERGLYKKMKVGEQAIYLAQLKGLSASAAKKELVHWFKKFDITHWWNKKVEDLSKGMAQKIQFIITVLHDPKLLILDEPFSGFDPINAQLIRNEIQDLKKNGASILLSTHNMNSVEEICDSIALIDQSKLILNGKLADVKSKFKSDTYAVQFKGMTFGFANALFASFSLEHSEQIDEHRAVAHVKLLHGNTLNDLLKTIMPVVEVEAVNEIIPSMNDVFIKAVQGKEGGENE